MKGATDRARFITAIVWLSTRMKAQGGKPVNADADFQDDYYDALDDIRIERIEWAAKHLFKISTWFPMPHEIRSAAMLAPSTVLTAVTNNQAVIPEFTEEQHQDAAKKLDEILNGLNGWGNI